MSTQSTLDASRDGLLSLPEATSHQLSKRQQCEHRPCSPVPINRCLALTCGPSHGYCEHCSCITDDALLIAEAGPSSNAATSPAAPASHPSFPAVASLCRQYPTQASAVFQAYLDLKNGAAAWDIVEPLVLSSNSQQGSTTETESAGRDLSSLSDAEAAEMVQEKLAHLKSGIARLGLVNDVPAEKAEEERDELFETGLAAIKGRRKDAVSSSPTAIVQAFAKMCLLNSFCTRQPPKHTHRRLLHRKHTRSSYH